MQNERAQKKPEKAQHKIYLCDYLINNFSFLRIYTLLLLNNAKKSECYKTETF